MSAKEITVKEGVLVFAARYAHGRNTGAAFMVVRDILSVWDCLSEYTKEQLYRESFEASYCKDDWALIQEKYEKRTKK